MTAKPSRAAFFLASLFVVTGFFAPARAAEVTEDFPVVKLQSLDKATARTSTFEARVGSTVKFGSLFIKVQSCRKTPPIELPEAAAFLQIWESATNDEPNWIFSGWMFASSPGLSSMDHPIYDVWVLDCIDPAQKAAPKKPEEKKPEQPAEEIKVDDTEAPPPEESAPAEPAPAAPEQ